MRADRHAGLEHEEILYRFLTVLGRFVACLADSVRLKMRSPLLQNDVRVTFVENGNARPRAFASKPRNVRVTLVYARFLRVTLVRETIVRETGNLCVPCRTVVVISG